MAENIDQIRQRSPFTTVDGTESILLQQSGVTKAGFLSVIRTWILDTFQINRDQINDATEFGRDLLTLEDAVDLNLLITHPPLPPSATQAEMDAGTETASRMYSPSILIDAIQSRVPLPKIPQSIDVDTTLTNGEIGSVLVCDASQEITVTVPQLALTYGTVQIINLAASPVSIEPDNTTLIDGTGTIIEKSIVQYEHVELIFLGNNTWYVREQ